MNSALVLPFNKIDKDDIPLVGGKAANLGEMIQAGLPVPNGFCVTSAAYQLIIKHNQIQPKIKQILNQTDVHNNKDLQKSSNQIVKLITKAKIPQELTNQIFSSYEKLVKGNKTPLVAVRSSATAEDLPDASFAGQQESFLNIKGEANLIQAVRDAWASLFGARAIFYRQTKGFDHFKVSLAVPIQLMIQSEISGVAFSINPVTNNKNQIIIEAGYGLGDYIVQGVITPDHYIVNKDDFTIHSRQIIPQTIKEVYKYPSGVKKKRVSKQKINLQKLPDDLILKLAKIVDGIQKHYYFPQDIEWALEKGQLYIVQSRPITTISVAGSGKPKYQLSDLKNLKVILQGQAASPGIATGKVIKIKSSTEINKVKTGDILVASMTSPDFVPAMKKAAGIITDKGGQTSHAAIVSRELGVPAIVGTVKGTAILKVGQTVTLDGSTGDVYNGKPEKKPRVIAKKPDKNLSKQGTEPLRTATKIYVNLAEPDLAGTVAEKNSDGVGLLRAEFMIAQIGTHPKKLIADKKGHVFTEKLTEGLLKFTQSFGDRPVIYRATDFKTNEYRNLIGGSAFEPQEANPMIGYRGVYRYLQDQSVFELEIEAIKRVRNKYGYKNLSLMLPFVHTVDELIKVKSLVSSMGLIRSPSFKLWMMVEVPSNVILLDDFINVGIDGISIGTNDLTMLILGADRDNEVVSSVYDERNPAVLWALEKIIKTANKHGITSSICGQAPSLYPDLTAKLVEWGITSVSVSPDMLDRTREIVSLAEKRLLKK
ncbi:phosphoenolpyruvate synthase [Patescibacteria group bacterium]|nr:phosphoenolpyruvate synthase [Patescibacteria group bacterium]